MMVMKKILNRQVQMWSSSWRGSRWWGWLCFRVVSHTLTGWRSHTIVREKYCKQIKEERKKRAMCLLCSTGCAILACWLACACAHYSLLGRWHAVLFPDFQMIKIPTNVLSVWSWNSCWMLARLLCLFYDLVWYRTRLWYCVVLNVEVWYGAVRYGISLQGT